MRPSLIELWWIGELEDKLTDHAKTDDAKDWGDSEENFVGDASLQVNWQAVVFLKRQLRFQLG